MARLQCLSEEARRGLRIALGAKQKVDGLPSRVHRPVQVLPTTFDLDVGFVDAVGIMGGVQVRPATLPELGSVVLHPTLDRGVFDNDATLAHHLFQVPIAQRLAQVPAHTQEDDLAFEVPPFERVGLPHPCAPCHP